MTSTSSSLPTTGTRSLTPRRTGRRGLTRTSATVSGARSGRFTPPRRADPTSPHFVAGLVANGYLKSDVEAKRDELLKLAQDNGQWLADSARSYTSWSDSKLREYLEAAGLYRTPKTREGLLREMRARFVPQKTFLDQLKDGVRNVVVGAHDVAGKGHQAGASASVSSALSAASASASSAVASAHEEL